jgi:site-specific recombinase XerD
MTNLYQAVRDYQGRYADEQNLTPKSRKNRKLLMNRVTSYFEDRPFDFSNCRSFLDEIIKTNSPCSMQSYVKDLHAFIRFLFKYEYIDKDFSNKIPMPKVEDRFFNLITETQAKEAILAGTKAIKMKISVIAHPNAKKPRVEEDMLGTIHVFVHEPPLGGGANKAVI